MIARWVLALQDYAFDLKHRAGLIHSDPDAFSRSPTEEPENEHEVVFDEHMPGRPGAFVATAALRSG